MVRRAHHERTTTRRIGPLAVRRETCRRATVGYDTVALDGYGKKYFLTRPQIVRRHNNRQTKTSVEIDLREKSFNLARSGFA
jgi:hypothetical protein